MSARKLALEALHSLLEYACRENVIKARQAIAALESELAQAVGPVPSIITALRFYANAEHYNLDGLDEFDTVSGEPQNWLCSGRDESATMIEDGTIARRALRGELIKWIDGDEDATPKPIEGEASHTAPQEPAAPAWMPIETAPKDDKALFACSDGIYIAVWRPYCIRNYPRFTHWMPLPKAPGGAA